VCLRGPSEAAPSQATCAKIPRPAYVTHTTELRSAGAIRWLRYSLSDYLASAPAESSTCHCRLCGAPNCPAKAVAISVVHALRTMPCPQGVRSGMIDVNDGLGKCLWGFLREIVADAAG
jgi:hypothetical protein